MREESHLDDMRAAIRGDFERLEERRGEQELMRVDAEEPLQELEPEPAPEPEPEHQGPEPAAEPEPEPELEEEPALDETVTSEDEEPAPERSWLDRLLGR